MNRLSVLLVLAAMPLAAEDRFDRIAAKLVQHINALDESAMYAMYDATMQNALPAAKTKEFITGLQAQFGKIVKIESTTRPMPGAALFKLKLERGALDMSVALDANDKLTGLYFRPPAPNIPPAPDRHETKLALPFKGHWLIFWGGDTPETGGHHLQAPAQRFAFDILGVGPDGTTHKGDGTKNEDYYAFGREILAPADGTVTDVITGVRDNRPGSMNPYSAVGNAVLIEHRPGEVSLFAHLQFGGTKIKPGDRVKAGQLIGLCGNSGNSSEPHLHYHLQNSTSFAEAAGIKVRFESLKVTRDAKVETKSFYSPVKGDVISE